MSTDKIKINLLPTELEEVRKKRSTKKWVFRVSFLIIILVVIITSGVFVLGIIQTEKLRSVNSKLKDLRDKTSSLNQQEGYLTLIKQKLVKINLLRAEDSRKADTLETLLNLIPTGVKITSANVDRSGEISFNGQVDSSSSLNLLVQNLTDPSRNSDKVSKVKVASLSKDPGDSFRFDVTVILK